MSQNDTSMTVPVGSDSAPIAGLDAVWDDPRIPCGADTTLRDDEHHLAVCRKPSTHTDAHEDARLGVAWTDEHHA